MSGFAGATWNVIRRDPPNSVVTADTTATMAGPVAGATGARCTATADEAIVPLGKPPPVTLTAVTFGSAALGVAAALKTIVDGDWPWTTSIGNKATTRRQLNN